jgi:predicted GNAT family acetyltransferase
MTETPEVTLNEKAHRFEAKLEGETALTEFNLLRDTMVVLHTEVPPAFEGRGVGSRLAKATLGYAREHGLKVKPICPFVSAYIQKHPEWQDLVHEDFRAKLGLD